MLNASLRSRLTPVAVLVLGLALSACETTGTGPRAGSAETATTPVAAAPPPPAEPVTRSKVAADCWMGTEKLAGKMDVDKRADVVNKCIDDKMKGVPAPKG